MLAYVECYTARSLGLKFNVCGGVCGYGNLDRFHLFSTKEMVCRKWGSENNLALCFTAQGY